MGSSRSLWWYGPVVLVITAGFAFGGALSYGTAYLGWFPAIDAPEGRFYLELFGTGLIGASFNCAKWWSLDHDEALENEAVRPTALDAFGYATTIVGGGVMGIILYLLVRYGVTLVVADGATSNIKPGAAALLAFVGGLFSFLVEEKLKQLVPRLGPKLEASTAAKETHE
jgi:hypothetical protein